MTHWSRTSLAFFVVIACLGVLMAGCGGKEAAPPTSSASSAPDQTAPIKTAPTKQDVLSEKDQFGPVKADGK